MKRETIVVAAVVAAIPLAVLPAATLCSLAVAHGASPLLRLPFRLLCHGIPGRCFALFGVPMPVCARCTGIYLGMTAGLAGLAMLRRVSERTARIFAAGAAVPMLIDGLTQLTGLRESNNALRLATGFTAALVFVIWVLIAVERAERRGFTPP